MILLPVIERELRAQARLPFTYGLRVLGAALLLVASMFFGINHGFALNLGGQLFAYLNCTLFFCIWILVPLLSADCISRERREATIGLLFLTPLNARGIVLAKGLVHGLRSLTLLLTVLPIITIAFLLGGVTWKEAVLSVTTNFSSICWALAAGLIASSTSKNWVRAQLLTCVLACSLCVLFLFAIGLNAQYSAAPALWLPYQNASSLQDQTLLAGFFSATDTGGWWGVMFSRLPKAAQWSWFLGAARTALVSALILILAMEFAAGNLRRNWQEQPLSARRLWLVEKFCTPVLWVSFFNGWMRRKLERNPIGWLEQRTWSGRLVTWGWFAVIISIYSTAFSSPNIGRALDALQIFMAWLLLGIMAVSAAGSFQRERETGVLELLLVSPMSVREIIGGRLRGLWGQFLPALVLLLGVWIYLSGVFPVRGTNTGLIQFFCGTFLTLPVIGLYYSLRRNSFISAFLSTVFAGLLLPTGFKMVLNLFFQLFLGINLYFPSVYLRPQNDDSVSTLLFYSLLRLISSASFITFLQLVIAFRIGRRLYRDMQCRNFAFSKAIT